MSALRHVRLDPRRLAADRRAGSVNPAKTDWLAMLEEYRERMGDEAAAVRANQHDTDIEYRATGRRDEAAYAKYSNSS